MDIPDSYPTSEEILTSQVELVPAPKALGLVQRFTYRCPEFSDYCRRLDTFDECPASFSDDKKKNFAMAGFYYLEPVDQTYKDCVKVKCFSCGLKLITNRGSHVLAYHVFVSKRCQYLQMIIPTFRYREIVKKYKEIIKFKPYETNQMLANDLMTEEEDEQKRCSVCLARKIQVLYLPCQHFTCCRMCSVQLSNCPICRSRIMAVTFPIY